MHIEVLSRFDHPLLPIIAMIIFVSCFTVFIYLVFKRENKKLFEEISTMPLHEGVKHER